MNPASPILVVEPDLGPLIGDGKADSLSPFGVLDCQ